MGTPEAAGRAFSYEERRATSRKLEPLGAVSWGALDLWLPAGSASCRAWGRVTPWDGYTETRSIPGQYYWESQTQASLEKVLVPSAMR